MKSVFFFFLLFKWGKIKNVKECGEKFFFDITQISVISGENILAKSDITWQTAFMIEGHVKLQSSDVIGHFYKTRAVEFIVKTISGDNQPLH